MESTTYSGMVEKRRFGKGSKSERDAIFLVTADGDYVLRRQGGNPYHDPDLERLIGKEIRCTGVVTGYTLLVSDYVVV